jgi:hypothetical protein
MIITKKALPRRTFLRGIGVTVALPLLDAMIPAATALAKTAAKPATRLGFIYVPNGAAMMYWQPEGFEWTRETWLGEQPIGKLSPSLAPLEPFKEQIIVPLGLTQQQAESFGDGNGEHSRAGPTFLSGVHPKHTEGADVRAGLTVDQLAAQVIGNQTPLRSLELAMEQAFLVGNCDNGYSCAYTNSISWRTPTTPNPMETNPRVVFQQLFGDGGSAAERRAQLQEDKSILDWVTADVSRLQGSLGAADRRAVVDYLDSLRELERRIQAIDQQAGAADLDLPDSPVGIPESYDEHAKLMLDLVALAFQADITRVFTFMFGREQTNRPYGELGVGEAHHPLSHHQNDPEKLRKLHLINVYHVGLLARLSERLKATPDGDGSLLDHSLILHGGGISESNLHSHVDLPLVLVGGGGQMKGGRWLSHKIETPMNNLLLAMLDRTGISIDKFGDSTGVVVL